MIVHAKLRRYLRRLLASQVLLVSVTAAVAWLGIGKAVAQAVLFGGATAMAGTLVLVWYGRRAERTGSNLARNAALIYGSAITRFATIVALFAVGIVVLRLEPLALFAGFLAGLLAQLISMALVSGK